VSSSEESSLTRLFLSAAVAFVVGSLGTVLIAQPWSGDNDSGGRIVRLAAPMISWAVAVVFVFRRSAGTPYAIKLPFLFLIAVSIEIALVAWLMLD
jgi:hypothetical protein